LKHAKVCRRAVSQRRAQRALLHSSLARTPKWHSRLQDMPEKDRRELSTRLDSSFVTVDTTYNRMAKTPEGALIAGTTYLLANQPQRSPSSYSSVRYCWPRSHKCHAHVRWEADHRKGGGTMTSRPLSTAR
jgi:hypothetical protein